MWEQAERRLEAQVRQADALDTKAGVLLGVHALAVGLLGSVVGRLDGAGSWFGIGLIGGLMVSGALAFLGFHSQTYNRSPSPDEMWRFAEWPEEDIMHRLLSTRFAALAENGRKLAAKASLLALSLDLLLVIALVVAAATIVGLVR